MIITIVYFRIISRNYVIVRVAELFMTWKFANIVFSSLTVKKNSSYCRFSFNPDILDPLLNEEVREFGKVRH